MKGKWLLGEKAVAMGVVKIPRPPPRVSTWPGKCGDLREYTESHQLGLVLAQWEVFRNINAIWAGTSLRTRGVNCSDL